MAITHRAILDREVIAYRMASAGTREVLCRSVNYWLGRGWSLYGSPFTVQAP